MSVRKCPIAAERWSHAVSARNGTALAPAADQADGVPDAGPWEAAVQKVITFQHLQDDWDGLGAEAPSREVLESAIGLAYLLSADGVEPPHAVVAGVDGVVHFEWQDPDGAFTDVEIDRPLHAEVMVLAPGQTAKHWTLPTA